MTGNCGYRDGEVHPHVDRCYRAGAVEALREAADAIDAGATCTCEACENYREAARGLRNRADLIASGRAVTS